MKKYVKFFMRNKKLDVTLPFEQAENVINSSQQLVKIFDDDGRWMGLTINKAEIIGTDRDFGREKDAQWEIMRDRALPEEYVSEIPKIDIEKYKPDFLKKISDG